jgi:SDR family mycofactocin-dependent oxidoreductase
MGRVEGKVALITGGARGQGRSHAVRLAEEGADVVLVDACDDLETTAPHYPLATEDDLAETVKLVEATGRRALARKSDVRSLKAMEDVVTETMGELGRLDIVVANAGIAVYGLTWKITEAEWHDTLDVNLTGVWHTVRASIPAIIGGGRGGSVVLTSSSAGLKGVFNTAHYTASKHGVVGIMRTLANEVARYSIRVNTIHPTSVDTPMIKAAYHLFMPGVENPTPEQAAEAYKNINALPIPWIEPIDVSNAVLWLASDEARYVTGVTLPIDAGFLIK